MSSVCKAKDKNNCRYHKPVDHARMEMVAAETVYNDALLAGTTQKMSNRQLSEHKAEVAVLKRKLVEAQIEYATFDEGYIELETAIAAAATPQIKHDLEHRKMRADDLKVEKEKLAKAAVVKAQRFEEIKKELHEYSVTHSWRDGYARAVAQGLFKWGTVLQDEGVVLHDDVLNEEYTSQKYLYGGREDREATNHLKECGMLAVSSIEENAEWVEFIDTYTDGTRHGIHGKVTCNCGRIVEADIECEGNFGEMTQKFFQ